jgi:serine/threonine protein phosphatase PrpC/pSer/pThr/pTyr-binding forkhead associated (FHA) protein
VIAGAVEVGVAGVAAVSDVGRRKEENQDRFGLGTGRGEVAVLVADGVSMSPNSAAFAHAVVETGVPALLDRDGAGADPVERTRAAVRRAEQAALGEAGSSDSTWASALVTRQVDGVWVTVGWVGDSRVYWVTRSGARLVTEDHAIPNSSILVRTVGSGSRADVARFRVTEPGVVVVVSDGMSHYLSPDAREFVEVFDTALADPLRAARELADLAKRRGGHDNITVALAPIQGWGSARAASGAAPASQHARSGEGVVDPDARLAEAVVALLDGRRIRIASTGELAAVLGSTPADVLAAAEGSGRLFVTRPVSGVDQLVVLAPPQVDTHNSVPPPAGRSAALVRLDDGRRHPLDGPTNVIGRRVAADIALMHTRTVSRAHAVVVHRADGWHLVDLAPTSPILVDEAAVGVEVRLRPGAVLKLGQDRYRFEPNGNDHRPGRTASGTSPPDGSPLGGGASLIFGVQASERQQAVIAHVVARMQVALRLLADDPLLVQLTGGWTAEQLRDRGCAGVCVVEGLNDAIAAVGGPGDLAVWADGDGWLTMDRRVYDALQAEVLDDAARRALFAHELTHTAHPDANEEDVHQQAPLPNLTRLAAAVGVAASREAPFVAVADAPRPRRGWDQAAMQAPELGARRHPLLARLARVEAPAHPGSYGSGVVYLIRGATGYVVTNRHVVDPGPDRSADSEGWDPGGARVTVTFAGGTFHGTVLPRPATTAIADELAAVPPAADGVAFPAGAHRATARQLDLAVIRIEDARLVRTPLAPLTFATPRPRTPVVVLGYPSTTIPVRLGDLATHGEFALVTGGLVTRVNWGDAEYVGNPWAAGGNSGGPVGRAGGDGQDVVLALHWGTLRVDKRVDVPVDGELVGNVGHAVEGAAIAAFLRASGLLAAPRSSSPPVAEPRSLRAVGDALIEELAGRPVPLATVAGLAADLGVAVDTALQAAADSPRLFLGQRGGGTRDRLVALAPEGVDARWLAPVPPGRAATLEEYRSGTRFQIRGSSALIARNPRADIPLDPTASAAHAMLIHRSDGWYIVNLDPTHPLTVNGRAGGVNTRLRFGDMIMIGRTWYLFEEPFVVPTAGGFEPYGHDQRPGNASGPGGGVAEPPLRDSQREQVAEALRAGANRMTPLEELSLQMPRAPPGLVRVWDGAFPVPGVIAFGWVERGVVVITREMAERIAARYALDPEGVQTWWDRLLGHEQEFHLGEHPEHTGPRHDAHAAPIAAAWLAWRGGAAGIRKPHGSGLERWWVGGLLSGDEMSMIVRGELADRLRDRLLRTDVPASSPEVGELLFEMVVAAIQLVRGESLGEPWNAVGPVRLHWLAEHLPALVDPVSGLAGDAGFVERDGVVQVFAGDEVGLLHAVVAGALAPAAGFTAEQAHVLAVLAERQVDDPRNPRAWQGWLTARARAELAELAAGNPGARVALVWDYERVRAEITERFADKPAWRELALRYAEEFHHAAIDAARLVEPDDSELRAEHARALAELRRLVADDHTLADDQRKALSRALRQADADDLRRPQIEIELGYLRAATERAGVWPTDTELLYLAVRNVTWGVHTYPPDLQRLRELAREVLVGTVSEELGRLLRPDGRLARRLVRVTPPAAARDAAGGAWVAVRAQQPHQFDADRIPLGSPFVTGWGDELPHVGELDQSTREEWAAALDDEVPTPDGFEREYATLRRYVGYTIAVLRGEPLVTRRLARQAPALRFYRLDGPISDPAGREVDALVRVEGDALAVYAMDSLGVLQVLTEALFAAWDGFVGEQRSVIAQLSARAGGPWNATFTDSKFLQRSWVSYSVVRSLQALHPDDAWRLDIDYFAERKRVRAVFADRPDWAGLVTHYLDQRLWAALVYAPKLRLGEDELDKEIASASRRAEVELSKIITDLQLPRADHRKARSDVKRGVESDTWHRQTFRSVAKKHAMELAVAAYYRGALQLPDRELIGLATRLIYWAAATAPRNDVEPALDVGDPIRDAVTAAYAQLLPETLRDKLELDWRHLHQVEKYLWEQRSRLIAKLVDQFGPDQGTNLEPGDGHTAPDDGRTGGALRPEPLPAHDEGLLSGRVATEREQAVIAHVVARMPVALWLPVGDPRLTQLTGGWTAEQLSERGCAGVCVVDGLNAEVAAAGGPGGLTVSAGGDGLLTMDRRVYDALRVGLLDDAGRHALFAHKLTHTAHPDLEERTVHDRAPLPDLAPLATAVGVAAAQGAVFVEVATAPGRLPGPYYQKARQAPELGTRPHPMIARLASIETMTYPARLGAGLVYAIDGATGYVVANRHVFDPGFEKFAHLEGGDPGGAQARVTIAEDEFVGTVLLRPATEAIANELAAEAGDDLSRDTLLNVARRLDLVLIRIEDERLTGSPVAPPTFATARPRTPLVVFGYPNTTIPTRSGNRPTGGVLALVMGGMATPLRVKTRLRHVTVAFVGNPWVAGGTSGGPVVAAGDGAGSDIVYGLLFGRLPDSSDGTGPTGVAVDGAAIAAFVRASGLHPSARSQPRPVDVADALVEAMTRSRVRAATVAELAADLGVPAETVLRAASDSARLFLAGHRSDPQDRLVVVAPEGVDARTLAPVRPGQAAMLVDLRSGARFPVHGPSALIARNFLADVALVSDLTVSRAHAMLIHRGDGWHLVSLGPLHPLTVNGTGSGTITPVSSGDVIKIGTTPYRFEELRIAGDEGVGGAGPIAEGGYSPQETRLMRRALARMWQADVARRGARPDSNRGPPEAGLRADEELFVPRVSEVAARLHRDGVPPQRAEDLARRMVEFSWRDKATGIGVIVVPGHRLAQLRRHGLLAAAVGHARRFHLDPNARHDRHAHDVDAGRVLDRLGRVGGRQLLRAEMRRRVGAGALLGTIVGALLGGADPAHAAPVSPADRQAAAYGAREARPGGPSELEVKRGDYPIKLADALSTTLNELGEANPHLYSPETGWKVLYRGQTVYIPDSAPGTWKTYEPVSTTADRFNVPGGWRALAKANQQRLIDGDSNLVRVGTELTIPVKPTKPGEDKPDQHRPGEEKPGQSPPPAQTGPPGTQTPSPTPSASPSEGSSHSPSASPTTTPSGTPTSRGPPGHEPSTGTGLPWHTISIGVTAVFAAVAAMFGLRALVRHRSGTPAAPANSSSDLRPAGPAAPAVRTGGLARVGRFGKLALMTAALTLAAGSAPRGTAIEGLGLAAALSVAAVLGTMSNAAFGLRGGLNVLPQRTWVAILQIGTFVVNLLWLVPLAVADSGLGAWISALYGATAAMFGLSAVNATYNKMRSPGKPVNRLVAWLVTWVAFPITSNAGNVLLTISVGWVTFDPVMLAVTVVLAVAFAYSSFLGMEEAVRPGRFGSKYLKVMSAAGSVSLMYWGLFALWPELWSDMVGAGVAIGALVAAARGASKFAEWRARLIHSPPAAAVAAWLGIGLAVGLPLNGPTTITAVAGIATAHALWILHRLVPPAAGPPSPTTGDGESMSPRSSRAAAAGLVAWARGLLGEWTSRFGELVDWAMATQTRRRVIVRVAVAIAVMLWVLLTMDAPAAAAAMALPFGFGRGSAAGGPGGDKAARVTPGSGAPRDVVLAVRGRRVVELTAEQSAVVEQALKKLESDRKEEAERKGLGAEHAELKELGADERAAFDPGGAWSGFELVAVPGLLFKIAELVAKKRLEPFVVVFRVDGNRIYTDAQSVAAISQVPAGARAALVEYVAGAPDAVLPLRAARLLAGLNRWRWVQGVFGGLLMGDASVATALVLPEISPDMQRRFGVSAGQSNVPFTVNQGTSAPALVASGFLAGRFSQRTLVVVSLVLAAGVLVGLGSAGGFVAVLGLAAVLGLLNIAEPLVRKLLENRLVFRSHKSQDQYMQVVRSSATIGRWLFRFGFIQLLLLSPVTGYQIAFVAMAVTQLVLAGAALVVLPRDPVAPAASTRTRTDGSSPDLRERARRLLAQLKAIPRNAWKWVGSRLTGRSSGARSETASGTRPGWAKRLGGLVRHAAFVPIALATVDGFVLGTVLGTEALVIAALGMSEAARSTLTFAALAAGFLGILGALTVFPELTKRRIAPAVLAVALAVPFALNGLPYFVQVSVFGTLFASRVAIQMISSLQDGVARGRLPKGVPDKLDKRIGALFVAGRVTAIGVGSLAASVALQLSEGVGLPGVVGVNIIAGAAVVAEIVLAVVLVRRTPRSDESASASSSGRMVRVAPLLWMAGAAVGLAYLMVQHPLVAAAMILAALWWYGRGSGPPGAGAPAGHSPGSGPSAPTGAARSARISSASAAGPAAPMSGGATAHAPPAAAKRPDAGRVWRAQVVTGLVAVAAVLLGPMAGSAAAAGSSVLAGAAGVGLVGSLLVAAGVVVVASSALAAVWSRLPRIRVLARAVRASWEGTLYALESKFGVRLENVPPHWTPSFWLRGWLPDRLDAHGGLVRVTVLAAGVGVTVFAAVAGPVWGWALPLAGALAMTIRGDIGVLRVSPWAERIQGRVHVGLLAVHTLTLMMSLHANVPSGWSPGSWIFWESVLFAASHLGFILGKSLPRLAAGDSDARDPRQHSPLRRWTRFVALALFDVGHWLWAVRLAFLEGNPLVAAWHGDVLPALIVVTVVSMAASIGYQVWHSFHTEVRNRPDHVNPHPTATGYFDDGAMVIGASSLLWLASPLAVWITLPALAVANAFLVWSITRRGPPGTSTKEASAHGDYGAGPPGRVNAEEAGFRGAAATLSALWDRVKVAWSRVRGGIFGGLSRWAAAHPWTARSAAVVVVGAGLMHLTGDSSALAAAGFVGYWPALRRRAVAAAPLDRHWPIGDLDRLARLPRERNAKGVQQPVAAHAAIWGIQGMSGRPTVITRGDRQAMVEAGHIPVFRGISGDRAAELADRLRTGETPFVGYSGSVGGGGTNFTADPAAGTVGAGYYARDADGTVLVGYLHRDAVKLTVQEARELRNADIRRAHELGKPEIVSLLGDLGVWAALRGIDALVEPSRGSVGTHYLVQNRTALFLEDDAPPSRVRRATAFLSRWLHGKPPSPGAALAAIGGFSLLAVLGKVAEPGVLAAAAFWPRRTVAGGLSGARAAEPGAAGRLRTMASAGPVVLRGRALFEWTRNAANAWSGLRPLWRVGAVLIVGVALAVFMGPGAAAMAAAVIPGPSGGGDHKPTERRGVLIAESDRGLVVVTDPAAVASVLKRVRELRDRGRVSPGDTSRLSPGGLWDAAHFWLYLADGLDAVDGLTVPGLRQVRVLYVLDVGRSAVIVPTTAIDAEVSRFDARITAALEHEIVRGLYGAAPENGWRPVAMDAGPVEQPAAPAPASLLAVEEYVDTLASKLDRPTAVLVRPRGGNAGLLVVHPRGSYDLDRTLETAAAYRVLGVPAVPTWPAVVAEDVLDGDGNVVLRAGERVEVGNYRGDGQVDLADLAQRVQVARLHAAAAALGETDVRGVQEANLVRDRAGNVGLVDFDQGMTLDRISVEFYVQIDIEGAPTETRDARRVFGLLTEADLLAGYQHVIERRAELMAVIRDPVRRLMVGARLDWMSQVVEAGRLPGWLRAQLETAQRAAAAAYPGAERLPDHAYRLGFSPAQTRLISSALARMRQEQRPVPRGSAGGNRDPPAVALRDDEVLFVFDSERLLAELGTRVSERVASDIVERLVTFAWWDAEALVIALSEDRLVELDRLGALGPAIDGARRRAGRGAAAHR